LYVADRANASKRWIDRFQSLPIHVGVAIDQSWDDRLALEIENPCPRRGVRRHGYIRSNRRNPLAGNRDCLGNREPGINRNDFGVLENEVSGLSR